MGFLDVIPSYFDDPADDEEEQRKRKFLDRGNVADMRTAVQQTVPETQGAGTRLWQGVQNDLGDLGSALASPIYYGAREAYRWGTEPGAQAAKYHDAAAKIADDPYGMATKIAGAVGQGIVEPYQRRPGEGFLDVAKRNVLDRPLSTLMDASALIGIPAGAAEMAGVKGAKVFADAARSIDPLTLAHKAVVGGLETRAPDAIARMEASHAITDLAAQARTRAIARHTEFVEKSNAVFQGLEPADKALFFPYVEGRLKTLVEGPETGALGELTNTGEWAPRGIDAGRLQRLEAARQNYFPILDEFEMQMGYLPEQYAGASVEKFQQRLLKDKIDPISGMVPASAPYHEAIDYYAEHAGIPRTELGDISAADLTRAVFEQKVAEATHAKDMRRTLSTRTALDTQKITKFNAEVEELKMSQGVEAAAEKMKSYPPTPSTIDEALAVMGPGGGLYFPHSGEVFTREQSTIGNVLTKVRESVPWKNNKAALFRSGALDTMDPEKALVRTHIALRGGMGRAEILDAVGQQFGEVLEKGYKFGTDEDFRAGTHQLLRPGVLHQEGALSENMQDLMHSLLSHGDDPAVASMDLHDLLEKASARIDETYPLKKDAPIYKIRKGTGDAIKAFTDSFEPSTSGVARALDTAADPFNFVTLNMRPARIVNNVVGNTIFQVLQGIHPFSTTGIGAISDMVQGVAFKAGLLNTERGKKMAEVWKLPGVKTGGLTESTFENSRTGTMLRESPIAKALGGKLIAGYAETLQRVNEHVEDAARALSTIFELRKQSPGLLGRMASSAKVTMDLGDRVAELRKMGVEALNDKDYSAALKNVNRFLNDYGRTSAFERTTLRRVFPYHKFYKHSLELAIRTPFEQPAKTAVLRSLGRAAKQDFEETLMSWGFDPKDYVPSWMQSSVPVGIDDNGDGRGPHASMLNLQGPNPFSLLSAANEGDPGREGLAALHPLVKTALEVSLGINLFTMQPFQGATTTFGGREVDSRTGLTKQATVRPGPISQFSKQFFPVQLMRDLVAKGRQPLDSSSLVDMIGASLSGHEGTAFKVNERGEAERRPRANPFFRLFLPVPQTLEAPTREQLRGQAATVTEQYRNIGRARPDLQEELKARRLAAGQARRESERPYRVKPRHTPP